MGDRDSMALLLSLAAQEAAAAECAEIAPAHLVIALSRLSELTEVGEPAAALQREFELLGIAPKPFRRRLRLLLGEGSATRTPEVLHRSRRCKDLFARASSIAESQDSSPEPLHLLYAVLDRLKDQDPADQSGSFSDTSIPTEL